MTTANKITLFRILLVPFFVYEFLSYRAGGPEWMRWVGLGSFAAAAILDGVDGFVARRFHQKSELGAVLDPLADKLLLVAGIVMLSLPENRFEQLPVWLPTIIITRDALLLIGLIVLQNACGKVSVRPRIPGKVATVLQMAVVLWALLKLPAAFQSWIAIGAGVMTFWSGIAYAYDFSRKISTSPSSGPTPGQ